MGEENAYLIDKACLGCKIVRRSDGWERDEDGGPGAQGRVTQIVDNIGVSKDGKFNDGSKEDEKVSLQYVAVAWDKNNPESRGSGKPLVEHLYRYPAEGQMDLQLVEGGRSRLEVGSRVQRGPDWMTDEDGSGVKISGRYGVVLSEKPDEWQVLWLNSPETVRRWYKIGEGGDPREIEVATLDKDQWQQLLSDFCKDKEKPIGQAPEEFFKESLENYQKGQVDGFKFVRQAAGLYDVPYRAVAKRFAWTLAITMIPTFICLMVHASLAMKRSSGKGHNADNFNSNPLWMAGAFSAVLEGLYVSGKLYVAGKKEEAANRTAKESGGAGVQRGRGSRAPRGVRYFHWVLSVGLAGLLPVFVLNSSMLWWNAAVDAHGYCAHECYLAGHSDDIEQNHFYHSACIKGGMNEARVKMYKEHEATSLTWQGDEGGEKCRKILMTGGHSKYTKTCLERGWTLLAFETLMRSESMVSVVEIYWSIPMACCLVLWKCMSLSLHKKNKDLAQATQVFLKQNIMNDPEQIWRYYENFLFLNQLHTGNVYVASKTNDYVLRLLHQIREKMMHNKKLMTKYTDPADIQEQRAEMKKLVNAEMMGIQDENADGKVDDESGRGRCRWMLAASKDQVLGVDSSALMRALVCTLIHLITPGAYRLWRTSFRTSHEYWQVVFPNELAIWPLAMNMLACSLAYIVMYYSAWAAAINYSGKYSLLLSFECMWSFPDESPLDLAEYNSGKGFMKMVAKKIMGARTKRHHQEDNYPLVRNFHQANTQIRTEEGNLYRLDFSSVRDYEKLIGNISNVNNWFQLRRYLQIEAIDDRVAVEMWSLLLLLAASFSVAVMVWNIFFAGLKRNRGAQQVMNVHCLVQFGFVCLVLAFSMSITLNFNNRFQNHAQQLQKVRDFMQSEYVKHVARSGQAADSDHKDRIDTLLGCLCKNLELFDKPATMFGLQINRAVVGRFTTIGLSLATTQLYPIIMNFVSGEMDEEDAKEE